MNVEIDLKGFNGWGWRVCDRCLLRDDHGCRLDFKYNEGLLNVSTGETKIGNELRRGDNEYWVDIRPANCIEAHGR